MTALLERAIEEMSALPESEQNLVAQVVLDTIEDEHLWDRQFAESREMLGFLADKALAEYESGKTREILA